MVLAADLDSSQMKLATPAQGQQENRSEQEEGWGQRCAYHVVGWEELGSLGVGAGSCLGDVSGRHCCCHFHHGHWSPKVANQTWKKCLFLRQAYSADCRLTLLSSGL